MRESPRRLRPGLCKSITITIGDIMVHTQEADSSEAAAEKSSVVRAGHCRNHTQLEHASPECSSGPSRREGCRDCTVTE